MPLLIVLIGVIILIFMIVKTKDEHFRWFSNHIIHRWFVTRLTAYKDSPNY